MKNVSLTNILFVCLIPAFIIGRCTAPKEIDTQQGRIDSLNRHMAEVTVQLERSLMQQTLYLSRANEAWERGYREGLKKKLTQTKFRNDTTRIISFSQSQRDSLIRAIYIHQ